METAGATVGEGATTSAGHDNGEQRPLRATAAVAGVGGQEEIIMGNPKSISVALFLLPR
jgi:hypothetical protein